MRAQPIDLFRRSCSRWLAVLVLLSVGACSALSIAYSHASTLAVLWINRAIDLPPAQRAELSRAADEVLEWHRDGPRHELAAMLREAKRRLAGQVSEADGEWVVASVQDHVRQIGERLALAFGSRMTPFAEDEIERMEGRLRSRREDFADEIGVGDAERERRFRVERIEEAIEDWLGPATAQQMELVRASPAVRDFEPRLWLAERARRERKLIEALRMADHGAALQHWFADWRSGRAPEVAARLDAQQADAIRMWVAVVNAATSDQRAHLLARLDEWIAVFEQD